MYERKTKAGRVDIEGKDGEKKGVVESPHCDVPSSFCDGADEAVMLAPCSGLF